MKTLKQISAESGLSKQAIRKRAIRAGVLDQLTKINGTLYADQDQEQKILEGLKTQQTTIDDFLNDQPQPNTSPTRDTDPEAQEEPMPDAEAVPQPNTDAYTDDGPEAEQQTTADTGNASDGPTQAQDANAVMILNEYLLKQIESKDALIQSLMEQNARLLQSLQYEQAKNKQIATAEPVPAEEPKKEEPKKKRSLLQRIFGY